MATEKTDIESPADYTCFEPGDARSLPTKHYPASGKLAQNAGKETTIEGPCTENPNHYKP